MTVFEWLVVGLGVAVVGWLVYRMNRIDAGSTNYEAAKPKADAAKVEASAEKKTTRKAPAKKPAAKKPAKK